MSFTQADLDLARAEGLVEGLRMALKIADHQRIAAEKELEYDLSSSVNERTEVRQKYAKIIAEQIKKKISEFSK